MVHTERTDKCPANSSSADVKSQPTKSAFRAESSYKSQSSSSSKTNEDKWKYNRMVKEDRDRFNNLHHC